MNELESSAVERDSRVIENKYYVLVLLLSRSGNDSPD